MRVLLFVVDAHADTCVVTVEYWHHRYAIALQVYQQLELYPMEDKIL